MQVNRYLKDKAMDRIDHALGRPVNPLAATYRDHYAANKASPEAAEMAASAHWDNGSVRGDLRFFLVSREGRKALADHLRAIGDRHRVFSVTWDGMTLTEVATSASKARYAVWLRASDCCEITFKDFCRATRVRLAVGCSA